MPNLQPLLDALNTAERRDPLIRQRLNDWFARRFETETPIAAWLCSVEISEATKQSALDALISEVQSGRLSVAPIAEAQAPRPGIAKPGRTWHEIASEMRATAIRLRDEALKFGHPDLGDELQDVVERFYVDAQPV